MPLLLGVFLAAAGGAGGYLAVVSGLFGGDRFATPVAAKAVPRAAFVPLDPLIISIGRGGGQRHLRFQAQLEVAPGDAEAVRAVLPRITDVLNGYLRAVDIADIEDPAALVRLRAQMLRRVQIIVGDGLVDDLLVMEFVLS